MTALIDWPEVSKLKWRTRNAHVQRAVRTLLYGDWRGVTCGTMELAYKLLGVDTSHDGIPVKGSPEHKLASSLAQTLAKMAPHMGPLATHDGEQIIRYGRAWRRWQWRGQAHA